MRTFVDYYNKINAFLIISLFFFIGPAVGFPDSSDTAGNATGNYKKTIEGMIVDENGNGIFEADVIIPEKNIQTKTDNIGHFHFEIFGGDAFHVEVVKSGFLPYSTRLIKSAKRTIIEIPEITLAPSPLEEVVVTGTATSKFYMDTPVKTFVAPKNAIERKGAQNLADSLEIVTGVRVEDNCQNCNFTQVRINGMEGKYSQILINSLPMVSSLAGVYALEQIPANMIEKLEVVKGGGSALYGGNAVAGVVNVILKEPMETGTSLSIDQGYTNQAPNSQINFNHDYVSKNQTTYASLMANYQSRKHMDYNGDGFSDLGELNNISIGSSFSHFFNRMNGKLKLGITALHEDRRGGNKFDLPEHFADIAESVKTDRFDISLGWEQMFNPNAVLKINAAYSYTKRDSYYGAEQDPNAYGNTNNHVFHTEVSYANSMLAHHDIVAGLSFNSDTIRDSAPAYDREIDATYTDFGGYVQDAIELFRDFTLLVGARADKHSAIDTMIISPRASVSYSGIKNLTLRGTFSSGFRAPQVFDEDLHITQVGGEGHIHLNRKGLKEERSRGFTLGLDFGKQSGNRLYQFSLGGFYNRIDNVFMFEEVAQTHNAHIFERFNGKGATVYGMELEVGFKIAGRFELFSGWTLQRSEYDEPEPDFGSAKMFRTPNLYGFVRALIEMPKFLDIHMEINYTGPMKVPHFAGYIEEDILEESDPFVVVDFTLSRKIKLISGHKFTITAKVSNVFDQFQQDLDKGIYRDAGYIYGPRIPRTFRLGVKYSF